jgi:hypothetical protein
MIKPARRKVPTAAPPCLLSTRRAGAPRAMQLKLARRDDVDSRAAARSVRALGRALGLRRFCSVAADEAVSSPGRAHGVAVGHLQATGKIDGLRDGPGRQD